MPRLLAAILLLPYPRTLRATYRDDLAASLEHGWRVACAERPVAGPIVAAWRWLQDVVRTRLGTLESRWMRHQSGGDGQQPSGRHDWTGDLRYAARTLARSPGFFAGVLLTLALGVGANAAVFSLVKAVVLQPLPYERPEELVMLWRSRGASGQLQRSYNTPRFLLGFRGLAADVVTVAGVKGLGSLESRMDFLTPAGAERLQGAFATPNFFELLGARPLHGRVFTAADEAARLTDVVVLSHAFWTRAFGGDPSAVGRTISLTAGRGTNRTSQAFTILGVLPPAFRFTYPDTIEVWALRPWSAVAAETPDAIGYQIVGRLRAGVPFDAAAARLAAVHDTIRPYPPSYPAESRTTTRIELIHDWVTSDARPAMALLAGVAVLLLGIACATVASALFIRVGERHRELALRAALGASRFRLIRQLLAEGAVLALAGTGAGIALALLLMPALRTIVPAAMPRGDEIGVDASVLGFAAAVTALVTVLAALAPAWRGSRPDVAPALKRGGSAATADRTMAGWRRTLVAIQAGLAAALLVAATMLLWSLWQLTHVPLGFDASNVLTLEMRVLDPAFFDAERIRVLQRRLVARVASVPGVRNVALASAVPFRGVDWTRSLDIPDRPGDSVGAQLRQVDPAYFSVMRIPLVRGRLIDRDDTAATPDVAVVSESLARELFGDAEAVGRHLEALRRGGDGRTTIVGIVADVRYDHMSREPQPALYVPREQQPSELICLLVETVDDTAGMGAAIRRAIREVEPALPAMGLATIGEIARESIAGRRFYTAATAVFAGLSLVLTMAGLVVVVTRAIVERRKELAIRTALGATAVRLRAGVVWHGLLPVGGGVAAGLLVAFAGASALTSFLFGIPPRPPVVYALAGGVLIAAATAAGWLAAGRAAAVSPSAILRAE